MEENKKVVEEVEIKKDAVDKAEKADVIVVEVDKKPGLLSRAVSATKKVVGKVPKPVKVGAAVAAGVAGVIAAKTVVHGLIGKSGILEGNFEEIVDSEEDVVSSDDENE